MPLLLAFASTSAIAVKLPAALTVMPLPVMPLTVQPSIVSRVPCKNAMPSVPPCPLIVRPFSVTTAAGSLIVMPLPLATETPA